MSASIASDRDQDSPAIVAATDAATDAAADTDVIRESLRRDPMVPVAASMAAAVMLETGCELSPRFWWWLLIAAATLWGGFWWWGRSFFATILSGWMMAAALMGGYASARRVDFQTAGMAFGWDGRPNWTTSVDAPGTIVWGRLVSTPHIVRSPLADSPSRRHPSPYQTRLTVDLDSIRSGFDRVPIDGRVIAYLDGVYDKVRPGDRLELRGRLEFPRRPGNPGGLDQVELFRRRGHHARILAATVSPVTVLERSRWPRSGGFLGFGGWFADLAVRGRESLTRHMGDRSAALAIGLVLGGRDALPAEVRDDLLVTGTVHVLSVSGLHLAIVATIAAMLCRALPPVGPLANQSLHWSVVVAACLGYVALTGGRPPVIRACVLVALVLLSLAAGRPPRRINTLAIAAIILMLIDPASVFSVGVHLSFVAVGTLLIAGRSSDVQSVMAKTLRDRSARMSDEDIDAKLDRLAEPTNSRVAAALGSAGTHVRRAAWLSLCVTAITTPLVWYQFNVVSIIAVVANLIIMPMLFFALASGLGVIFADLIWQPLAAPPAWIGGWVVRSMMGVVDVAAAVPMGHAWLPAPPLVWVVVFYVGLLALVLFAKSRRLPVAAWVAIWVAAALVMTLRPAAIDGDLEATFVDVGHGTSVLVRDADHAFLYDCGNLGNDSGQSRHIDTVLWHAGVTHLDAIVLSHADADHFNALPSLLRRFRVDRVITPPGMLATDEAAVRVIVDAIARRSLPVLEASSGDRLMNRWTVLHPPRDLTENFGGRSRDNARSLVLIDSATRRPLLLPGDLEPPGTAMLSDQPRPRPGGVLMAPHHGSLRADADRVISWARPSRVVVSGGRRATAPAVTEMLSAAGADVDITHADGAVRYRWKNGRVTSRRYRIEPW